jgi:flagellar biosynthesis chaperone FliJ
MEDKIKDLKPNITGSTLKTYIYNINLLKRQLNEEDDEGINFLKNYTRIIAHINENNKSLNTKKNKFSSVVVVLQAYNATADLIRKYNEQIESINKQLNDKLNQQEKSEKQAENWISKDELNSFILRLKNRLPREINDIDEYAELRNYILVLFHSMMPLRNDLSDTKIYTQDDFNKIKEETQYNYIILNNEKKTKGRPPKKDKNTNQTAETGDTTPKGSYIIMNNYKTRRIYGRMINDIPDELATELKNYYPYAVQYSPEHFLLVNKQQLPYTRNALTKLFISIFKLISKRVSSSMIRHSIISDLYKPELNKLENKQRLARVMGHSIAEAEQVYAKI